MTKEEVIKILQNIYFEAPEIKEALQIAIETLSRPSLPSGLDETAEEYALDVKAKPFANLVKEAFKSGAKWMVEQFQQEQLEADLDREIIKYKVPFTDDREYLNETTLDAIARHFAEWGAIHLNAIKEE